MEVVLIVVGVIAFLLLRSYFRMRGQATSIAKRHSFTLSQRTGIPADQIYKEMRRRDLTPGEWAAAHGLHPLTFEPLSRGDEGHAEG